MITNQHQDNNSQNEGIGKQHQQTNMLNNEIEHNHNIYHNRNRNKHIILLLIAILICKCCAVTGDTTGKQFNSSAFFFSHFFNLFHSLISLLASTTVHRTLCTYWNLI